MTMTLDSLDQIAASVFDGYLVRKDLVRKYSRQYPVPTYVVEFHSIELSKVLKKQSDTQSILLQLCDPKPTVDRWILVPEGSTSSASRQTVLKLAQKGIEVSIRMLQL